MTNALSFSPAGGIIQISVSSDGERLNIKFEDQGPGVPDDLRESIFKRFYKFRPEGEVIEPHSGLGLSISQQIIEGHGGVIKCTNIQDENSNLVKGACFSVMLPLLKS